MKVLSLTILISLSLTLYGQKYTFTNVEVMTSKGELIQRWKSNTHVTMSGGTMVVGSDDDKLLHAVAPKSLFDISSFRSYTLVSKKDSLFRPNPTDTVDTRIIISEYIGLVYHDKLMVMGHPQDKYIVLIPDTKLGIVLYGY